MSNMQNYLLSRPVCGFKHCQSDTPQLVGHRGRTLDKKFAQEEIYGQLSADGSEEEEQEVWHGPYVWDHFLEREDFSYLASYTVGFSTQT